MNIILGEMIRFCSAVACFISHFTCSSNNKAGWYSDVHFEIPKFTEEFSLVQVGHFMPSFCIIHRWLRIPLCYLVRTVLVTTAGKYLGEFYMKWSGYDCWISRRKWLVQKYLHDILVLWMIFNFYMIVIYFKIEPVYVSTVFFMGKIKICAAYFQELFTKGCLIIFVRIWP